MVNNNGDPIISVVRKGTSDSPYKEFNEPLIIDNSGKVQLTEYPNFYYRVVVKGDNKDWIETNDDIPNTNAYKVDYNHKTVTFHKDNIGKQLNFEYQGMGNSLISAKNIYTERDGLEIKETLQSLTDSTKEARDTTLSVIADTEIAIENANTATTNADSKAEYAQEQGDYAKQVADDNKTNFLNAVETISDRDNISNPTHGDTVRVTSTAETYRYTNENGWVLTDKYNPTAIDEINQNLAQTTQEINQIDFVKLLQNHNQVADKLYAKVLGDRNVEVVIPFKGKRSAHFAFRKNPNDDYIKFHDCAVSELAEVETEINRKNYESVTGAWYQSGSNHYTSEIGATFSFAFTGTGFDFIHCTDDRGGLWEFTIDDDEDSRIQISTWSPEFISYTVSEVVRGLEYGEHNVVATNLGEDPNVTYSTSCRSWVSFNEDVEDRKTIRVYDTLLNPTKVFDISKPSSNKEFAIGVRPNGTDYGYEWLPEHSSTPTVFAISQKILFDEDEITSWNQDDECREVKSVKIIQKMNAYHPEELDDPLAEIISIHSISANGVSIKVKFNFLRKTDISSGYGLMIPAYNTFANQLITSYGNRYDSIKTDGSRTDLNGEPTSFAFISADNTDNKSDTLLAITVDDSKRTFRKGETDRRNPLNFLEHRDTEMQKLYCQIYSSTVAEIGDNYENSYTFFIGELLMANELLPNNS